MKIVLNLKVFNLNLYTKVFIYYGFHLWIITSIGKNQFVFLTAGIIRQLPLRINLRFVDNRDVDIVDHAVEQVLVSVWFCCQITQHLLGCHCLEYDFCLDLNLVVLDYKPHRGQLGRPVSWSIYSRRSSFNDTSHLDLTNFLNNPAHIRERRARILVLVASLFSQWHSWNSDFSHDMGWDSCRIHISSRRSNVWRSKK